MPGVRETSVTARGTDRGAQLTAWVVRRKSRAPDVMALRRDLRESLPPPRVSLSFTFVDVLPHAQGGEVDKGALLHRDERRPAPNTAYVPPRGDAEEKVATIFAESLGLPRVGAEDDFFDLGGSSLDAQESILRLGEAFGREPDTTEFLLAPTPAALALRLTRPPAREAASLIPLRRGDGLPVFFVPAPLAVDAVLLAYSRLARRLHEGRPFLAFHPGENAASPDSDPVKTALRVIRAVQPRGPYTLVGECAGGVLAWEMARRLSAEGDSIDLLALLDTPWRPHWRRREKSPFRQLFAVAGDDPLRRVGHHLRALRDLSVARWPGYLWEEGVVARAAYLRARRPEVKERLRRRKWYAASLRAIPLKPWAGRLHYIQSADSLHRHDATGWATLAGSIDVVHVPGEHRTYLGAHVDSVAEALSRWIPPA
ncbi:MAG: thioesterase domain-containing protein [Thermoanaerobaculia bacterium]